MRSKRQVPRGGSPDEEELTITPEMLEAGADTLSRFFSFDLDDPEKIVAAVFVAMRVLE